MLVNTAVLGPVDVDDDNVFHLPGGVYGFERKSDYALIKKQDDDITLMWFQAVDASVPCFLVFNPFEIIEGYQPIVEPADLKLLGCDSISDLVFLVIAVIPEDIGAMTVNLKSPIVINRQIKQARQIILANRDYPIKFPLFPTGDVSDATLSPEE